MAIHGACEGLHFLLALIRHQPQFSKLPESPLVLGVLLQFLEGIHLSLAFEGAGTVLLQKYIESQQGTAILRAQFGHIN